MKYFTLFLVLALLTMMPEPGDAFFHHIINGFIEVGKSIHGLVRQYGKKRDADVLVLEDRAALE